MTATEKPLLLGAVDLGSNSFRVEVGRVVDDQILTESYWKETVRLAAGFDEKGFLTEEAQKRALNALSRFKEKLAGVDPKYIRAVGTQALRVAKNSDEFLPKAEAALGHPIEIIAGREEARLVFSGCAHTLPSSPEKRLVVDIGGGTTEVAVISLGGIVSSRSIRIAGNALDSAIINYLKKENQINIGDKMAEDIKVAIASAYEDDEEGVYEVRGRDVATGLPKTAQIKESEIRAAISENVDEMIEAIKLTLENTPPELAADVMERGIVLTGGGALIKGLDKLITETTKIPTHVAEYPLDCVAIGTGKALDNIKELIESSK